LVANPNGGLFEIVGLIWDLIFVVAFGMGFPCLEMDYGSLVFDLIPLFWKLNGRIYVCDLMMFS
jgi:hypothetical protein